MTPEAAPSFDEVVSAHEWVSAAGFGENTAYICRATGRVYWASDAMTVEELDELPEGIEDEARYLPVPHKRELDLGRTLALRFVEETLPARYELAVDFFRRSGAYRRFRALLEREGVLDDWYKFEESAVERELRAWLAQNGLPFQPATRRVEPDPPAAEPRPAGARSSPDAAAGELEMSVGNVYCEIGMSLDGFIAGLNGGPGNPLGDGGQRIHEWVYPLASFRERLGLSEGETNSDDELVKASFARPGAYVMGRRMFDEGEAGWPADAPFRVPVFVVSHRARAPWVREGGTTFHFVTDGIQSALRQAKEAAAGRDIRVAGGANIVQQFLNAGLIDELRVHLAPVMLGAGVRLFDQVHPELALEPIAVIESPLVTHLVYRVGK